MFPGLTLPLVTLAFVKATSQFPCSRSLTVGWPDIPSLPDSCLTSPAADQRLTSLSLPGKRMLSLSPAVPHFDHLIKVVPAAHLHYATGMSLGPSSTAVQGVLCDKVFWDRINVLLLYKHPLILVSLRNLHWIMCLGGGAVTTSLIEKMISKHVLWFQRMYLKEMFQIQRFPSQHHITENTVE